MIKQERITPYPVKYGLSIIEVPKGSKVIGAGWSKKWHITSIPYDDHVDRLCIHILHDIDEKNNEFRGVLAVSKRKITSDFNKNVLKFVSGEGSYKQKVETKYPNFTDLNSCVFIGPPNERYEEIPSVVLEQLVPLKT